jgi:hypothetical protein
MSVAANALHRWIDGSWPINAIAAVLRLRFASQTFAQDDTNDDRRYLRESLGLTPWCTILIEYGINVGPEAGKVNCW